MTNPSYSRSGFVIYYVQKNKKELDIPAGFLVDLVPGINLDPTGRPILPSYVW